MNNRAKELLDKVADRMTLIKNNGFKEECSIGIIDIDNWEWPQGVGMYGLYKYYSEQGEKKYFEYIIDWYDKRIAQGLPEKNVNTMAPMLTLAHLAGKTQRKDYIELCGEWADWVMQDMPRAGDGALQHITTGERNDGQIWIDTLFMTVLFLAKAGLVLGREDYIQEAEKQFLVHIKYLYDKKTGLWFHGFSFNGMHNFAKALWARGNCWYTAGVTDFIETVDLRGSLREYLIDTLAAQVKALAKLQTQDGMWHTLLTDPSSYVETSATAGFGYGILKAVRKGYIDKKYKAVGEKALNAVIRNIKPNGEVDNVSYGTGISMDLDHYRNIPICPMTYGQALAILILLEGLMLEDGYLF